MKNITVVRLWQVCGLLVGVGVLLSLNTLSLPSASGQTASSTTPVISNVQTVNIVGSGAQITWITDIVADSAVAYGTSSSNYTVTTNNRCDAGGYVTSHCVILISLNPATIYYYRVGSGNGGPVTLASGFSFMSATAADTQPPTAPSNLGASPVSTTQVNLSWSASSDNFGVTGYRIYRNSSLLTTLSASTLSYSDTGLTAATAYTYYLTAVDAAGNVSPASPNLNWTTPSGTSTSTVPATPSNLTGTVSGTSITLAWTDNSSNETRFEIYRQANNGTWLYYAQVGSNVTTYSDSGLSGTYSYQVAACNGTTVNTGCSGGSSIAGPFTIASTTASSTDTIAPSVPPAPTLSSISSSQIVLTWPASTDNVGVTGYKVYRYVGGSVAGTPVIFSVPTLNLTETSLSPATSYTYTIAAYDAAGNVSSQGPGATGTTFAGSGGSISPPVPSTPTPSSYSGAIGTTYTFSTILYPSPNGSQVKAVFDWGDGMTSDGTSGLITPSSGGTTVSASRAWSASGTYSVRAKAVDSAGLASSWSNAASMTVAVGGVVSTTIVPVVSNVRAVNIIGSGAQITWTTDIVADSSVAYGTTSSIYTGTTNNRCDAGGYVTSHCVNLINLNLSTTYYYQVGSSNGGSVTLSGPWSFMSANSFATSSVGVSTTTPPAAPSNLMATVSGSSVYLSWTDNSTNETGFKLYRGPVWTDIGNVGPGVTSFADNNLVAGTYAYHLNAFTASSGSYPVYSGISNDVTVTVNATSTVVATSTSLTAPVSSSTYSYPVTVLLTVDGGRDVIYRVPPASYTLKWETSGGAVNCSPSGDWAGSGPKSVPAGSQYLSGITALGVKTYGITCVNGSSVASDAVTVQVVASVSQAPSSTTNAYVRGTVRDPQGKSVPGVGVHVVSSDFSLNFGGVTDGQGLFQIGVPAGSYFLEVFTPSNRPDLLRPSMQTFSLFGSDVKQIDLQFLLPAKTLTGNVRFSSGLPVTDAEVGAYSEETRQWTSITADAQGRYTLQIGGGSWQIGARPKDPNNSTWSAYAKSGTVSFAKDSSAETQTFDIIIPSADIQVTVKTTDQNGTLLSGADVVLDTLSSNAQSKEGVRQPPVFRRTDGQGKVIFYVKAGVYYLRSFLPSSQGFLNPDEQMFVVIAGQSPGATLVFRKPESVASRILTGVTKLEDGTPTDAFLWAWSEKGGSTQTTSDPQGRFQMSLATGITWHVGAGKVANGYPYKASDLIVTDDTQNLEILLSKFRDTRLPPSVQVSQSASQQILAQSQDGTKVTVPENAAQSSGQVNLSITPTVEAPSQAGAKLVGNAYDVNLKDSSGNNVKNLQKAIEIVLPYDKNDLKKQGVTEDSLVPSYFDEAGKTWKPCESYTIDKVHSEAICRVNHLTRFALVAAADTLPPPAPASLTVGAGKDGLVLNWTNPARNFDHAKIYRSTSSSDLGSVISPEVSGSSQVDATAQSGVRYYYVVRSVSPAGNESTNTTPTSGILRTASPSGLFKRTLSVGARGSDIVLLQQILTREGTFSGGITGYLGPLTRAAVVKFQEKYASEILAPNGLSKGTGSVGSATRAKLNALAVIANK